MYSDNQQKREFYCNIEPGGKSALLEENAEIGRQKVGSSPLLCVKSFRYNQVFIKLSTKHPAHEQPGAVYLLC